MRQYRGRRVVIPDHGLQQGQRRREQGPRPRGDFLKNGFEHVGKYVTEDEVTHTPTTVGGIDVDCQVEFGALGVEKDFEEGEDGEKERLFGERELGDVEVEAVGRGDSAGGTV